MLRRGENIVGYAKWDDPSEHRPDGLIRDPIVPDEDPMVVIASVQSAISTPRAWQTFKGSKYESSLRSLAYPLEQTTQVDMFLAFGQEIDLTGYHRTTY